MPTMKLTSFDQIMVRGMVRFLLFFKVADQQHREAAWILQQGLISLHEQIPFLSGNIKYLGNIRNELEIWYHSQDELLLQVKDLKKEMASLAGLQKTGYPLSALSSDLLSPCADRMSGPSQPVFSIQANLIEGGLILCVCAHHNVVDGSGFSIVMQAFAAHCEAISTGDKSKLERYSALQQESILRGGLFQNIDKTALPKHDYKEYHAEDALSKPGQTIGPAASARLLLFSPENLAKLKNDMTKDVPAGSFISTADALGALLWCTITAARLEAGNVKLDEVSSIATPVDNRRNLKDMVPSTYLGNTVITTLASLRVRDILRAPNLASLALNIRNSIHKVSQIYTLGLIQHAQEFKNDLNTLKPTIKIPNGPDINHTSWSSFPMYDLDFGKELGKIEVFRCPWRALDGCTKVLPKRRDGATEVIVELETRALDLLLKDETLMRVVSQVVD